MPSAAGCLQAPLRHFSAAFACVGRGFEFDEFHLEDSCLIAVCCEEPCVMKTMCAMRRVHVGNSPRSAAGSLCFALPSFRSLRSSSPVFASVACKLEAIILTASSFEVRLRPAFGTISPD